MKTQMDLAAGEFNAALNALSKEDELYSRKKQLTEIGLSQAQRGSHNPAAATLSRGDDKEINSVDGRTDDGFKNVSDSNGKFTCPICHKPDAVVPINYGCGKMTSGRTERHGKHTPQNFEERLQSLLTKERGGDAGVANAFCNRCNIEFMQKQSSSNGRNSWN